MQGGNRMTGHAELLPMIQRGTITQVGGNVEGTSDTRWDKQYTVESLDYPGMKTRKYSACALAWANNGTQSGDAMDVDNIIYNAGDKVFFVLFPDGSGLILRRWYPQTFNPGGDE